MKQLLSSKLFDAGFAKRSKPSTKRKDEKQTSWEGLHPLTHSYAPWLISLCWSPASDTACGHFNWLKQLVPLVHALPWLCMLWWSHSSDALKTAKASSKAPRRENASSFGKQSDQKAHITAMANKSNGFLIKHRLHINGESLRWSLYHKVVSPYSWLFTWSPQRRCGWCSAGGI